MKIIAHRGASFEAKENSIEAVLRAKELEVHAIEIDVHLSKDSVPVVIHDPHFPSGKRVYDTQSNDEEEEVVTLREILQVRGNIQLMIELKEGDSPKDELALKTLQVIRGHTNIIIGSFCPEILQIIHIQAPEIPLIAIVHDEEMLARFLPLGIDHFALHYSLLGKIKLPKKSFFWVWTVDDPVLGKRLLKEGASGIITNNPRLFLSGHSGCSL